MLAEHRIDDMTAIKLPDRDHVERRHEHSEPTDRKERIVVHLIARRKEMSRRDEQHLQHIVEQEASEVHTDVGYGAECAILWMDRIERVDPWHRDHSDDQIRKRNDEACE